jgi:hypothetical protein
MTRKTRKPAKQDGSREELFGSPLSPLYFAIALIILMMVVGILEGAFL